MLKGYLSSGHKTYKNSHPFYWNPRLFHLQVFKALMGQPPETEPSVTDGKTAIVRTSCRWNQRDKAPKQPNIIADWGTHLQSVVCIQEQVPTADAAVDTAQGHEEAEGEEVPMIKVTYTIIQPGWGARI